MAAMPVLVSVEGISSVDWCDWFFFVHPSWLLEAAVLPVSLRPELEQRGRDWVPAAAPAAAVTGAYEGCLLLPQGCTAGTPRHLNSFR